MFDFGANIFLIFSMGMDKSRHSKKAISINKKPAKHLRVSISLFTLLQHHLHHPHTVRENK